jgi:hypothetical protein
MLLPSDNFTSEAHVLTRPISPQQHAFQGVCRGYGAWAKKNNDSETELQTDCIGLSADVQRETRSCAPRLHSDT